MQALLSLGGHPEHRQADVLPHDGSFLFVLHAKAYTDHVAQQNKASKQTNKERKKQQQQTRFEKKQEVTQSAVKQMST